MSYICSIDPKVRKWWNCDSISQREEFIYNKLLDLKNITTDDLLVDIAMKNTPEISLYCFQLLCSEDNPKCKKILKYYLNNNTEIWVEECGQRKKQRFRNIMLDRAFDGLHTSGRKSFINIYEFEEFCKIAKDYKKPFGDDN